MSDIFETIKDIAKENPKLAILACLFGIAAKAVIDINESSSK